MSSKSSSGDVLVIYFCHLYVEFLLIHQEEGLTDVQEMIRLEKPNVDRRLRGVLEELGTGCNSSLKCPSTSYIKHEASSSFLPSPSVILPMPTSFFKGVVPRSNCVSSHHVERLTTETLPKLSVRS
ncbi:hypothetical protein TNCV_4464181 [Trichonephila clavipes]|nr:hypothetical protein TNCV_4464181 [Trichonephila clavipes]